MGFDDVFIFRADPRDLQGKALRACLDAHLAWLGARARKRHWQERVGRDIQLAGPVREAQRE